MENFDFDVIVIGGGHAGTEAAHATARMGCRTALLTLNPERIGFMSCNPAMGGLAKGQLIKEIDALGGIMGRITDQSAIQYRQLNSSKGPAVRSSRAQCDKALYAVRMQEHLATVPGLTILGAEAAEILAENGSISGLRLKDGSTIHARAVVVTSGTFMRAIMFTGADRAEGGRAGDASSKGLSGSIERLGFRLGRLKTGTPPRLHKDSIDWSKTEAQPGDIKPRPFSFYHRPDPFPLLPQINCHITYTNERTHEIIEANFGRSPMFTGMIKGVGPRYCPSIEDKVKRFRERERHQIFLEPEGLTTDEVYVNGISTSLPSDVQEAFVRTIPGCERAQFIRFGYAVEYDCVDARQLRATFESKDIQGLFFAGQVNGTSGYEEAGAQGLIAGINAARRVKGGEAFIVSRLDGYIGVLADDLVLHGADEPYRMFTSRAEYRLLLREDNADLRLTQMGRSLGLIDDQSWAIFEERRASIEMWKAETKVRFARPTPETLAWFEAHGLPALKDRASAENLLKRPEISWKNLIELKLVEDGDATDDVAEQVETQIKYAGYIQRDLDLLEGIRKNENLSLPVTLDFEGVSGLSSEVRGRLKLVRPETLGQASRLPGMTPAAMASLLIHMKIQENQAVCRE